MQISYLTVLLAASATVAGCNKATPVDPAPTVIVAPKAVAPASYPTSDPSLPSAAGALSPPASSASGS